MTRDELAAIITVFMFDDEKGGGTNLELVGQRIFDPDSNWGFDPLELADAILAGPTPTLPADLQRALRVARPY